MMCPSSRTQGILGFLHLVRRCLVILGAVVLMASFDGADMGEFAIAHLELDWNLLQISLPPCFVSQLAGMAGLSDPLPLPFPFGFLAGWCC